MVVEVTGRWCAGDAGGPEFPVDPQTLHSAGPRFLTAALRWFGVLADDNQVCEVTRFEEAAGGSTGRKALLDVRYEHAVRGLPTELFVKFSRDLTDPRRDRGKSQMELEVAFGVLTARTELPVTVPDCVFADYHHASATGILITRRIPFGSTGIEPHRGKCLDYLIPDPLAHYRALLTSVARLAGAHRSGALPPTVDETFRYDAGKVAVGSRRHRNGTDLTAQVHRLIAFAQRHPALVPVTEPDFAARMLAGVCRIADAEDAIMDWLTATDMHVALCHWNANVDNAWFWTRPDGTVDCGLMDWGCVSVMNVAMALWGSLCSAETVLWEHHLDELLTLFADEYREAGGPELDLATLHRQLVLYAAVMGVAWLLDAPAYLSNVLPDRDLDRFDPIVAGNESVRSQLLMLNNVLYLWQRHDVGALLDEFAGEAQI